jgi:glutaconate CoA-transferase subunit B
MMEDYGKAELMAVVLSRELKDRELGSPGGAYSQIAMAAIRLAQLTHAPNLSFVCSATGYINHMVGKRPYPLLASTTDYRNIYAGCEAALDFRSMPRRRDFFFVGGLQVDKYGNINLIGIGTNHKQLKMRGPGTAGLSYATAIAGRFYIYLAHHTKRLLVDKVDFMNGLGYIDGPGSRERLALPGKGPQLVVTPLAVMDFEPESKRMRLKSLHPGVSLQEVLDNTSLELIVPDNIPTTQPPTVEEITCLREQIDIKGVLRTMI